MEGWKVFWLASRESSDGIRGCRVLQGRQNFVTEGMGGLGG